MTRHIRRNIGSITLIGITALLTQGAEAREGDSYEPYRKRPSIMLKGTHRDFRPANAPGGHADFGRIANSGAGRYAEIVEDQLDLSDRPVFRSTGRIFRSNWQDSLDRNIIPSRLHVRRMPGDKTGIIDPASGGAVDPSGLVNTWYRNIPGMNTARNAPLTLILAGDRYVFDGTIDDITGSEDRDYTYAVETMFIYERGEDAFIEVATTADTWIFVDGNLVIDSGAGLGNSSGSGQVLLVVADANKPSREALARRGLIESWGYNVDLIDDNATRAQIDAATLTHEVVYITDEVSPAAVATAYHDVDIGVVNECRMLSDMELGFSTTNRSWMGRDIVITENTHPITAGFPIGPVQICNPGWTLHRADGGLAMGATGLARLPNHSRPALLVVDRGHALYGGRPATSRRVRLPWGASPPGFNTITPEGETIMQRALIWASEDALRGGTELVAPPTTTQRINLDRLAWLRDGRTYDLRIFTANRSGTPSSFRLETDIDTLRLAATLGSADRND